MKEGEWGGFELGADEGVGGQHRFHANPKGI